MEAKVTALCLAAGPDGEFMPVGGDITKAVHGGGAGVGNDRTSERFAQSRFRAARRIE